MSAKARAKVKTMKHIVDTLKHRPGFGAKVSAYTKVATSIRSPKDFHAIKNDTIADVLNSVENLATDCLRLSMYFFYPIQQCAQQVYHTALPLSPTSSQPNRLYLQIVAGCRVSTFSGAPSTWGLLLRTINLWPRQLTCIATSAQIIITACEDVVIIYDALTFVLQQSIQAPETVAKMQCSLDGSILFFAHSFSVTMWDVQTGGLIHTFITQSQTNDMAVSASGDYLACGLSSGSIVFWNTQSKKEGKGFGNGQPVVTTYWISPEELAVATQNTLYIHNITTGEASDTIPISGHVWGMVYLEDRGKFLVGTLLPSIEGGQEECCFVAIKWAQWHGLKSGNLRQSKRQPPTYTGQLLNPILVGEEIACITPANGVQLFNTISYEWTNSPPLLDAAKSMAVSLNRNLVVQTKNSIQIFSVNVMESHEAHNDAQLSHIYPLGKSHILCVLQPTRCLTLLELDTLQKIQSNDLSIESLFIDPSTASCRLISNLGIHVVAKAWQSGTPLPNWTEATKEGTLLHRQSPGQTYDVTVYNSPQPELHVKCMKGGTTLANLPLEDAYFEMGEVYDLTFQSETRFHIMVDGPRWHVKIPCNITALPSGTSHTITKGEPIHLSEPRATPPYKLDENCEWVLDAESRKICWISPGNLRRGNGGYFWAGLSLIMVGDDGVVRKVTFKEPGH